MLLRAVTAATLLATLSLTSAAKADVIVSVTHEVKDFNAWKKGFDADAPNRAKAHMTELYLGRGLENPNVVHIAFRVPTADEAKTFVSSPKLKEAMEKAGVIGAPTIEISTVVEGGKKAK